MEKLKKFSFSKDIEKICNKRKDEICIYDEIANNEIKYFQIFENINKIISYLKLKGLKSNHYLISCLENSSINYQVFLSLMYYGFTYSPLTPDTTINEFKNSAKIFPKLFVLISDGTNKSLIQYLKRNKIKYLNVNKIDLTKKKFKLVSRKNNNVGQLVLNSSGTTGDPKKILINIDKLWTNGKNFSNLYSFINSKSIFLNILPMSYLGGLFNLGLIPMSTGSSIVITKQFSGHTFLNFWSLVFRYKVNVLWLVPTILKGLLNFTENFINFKKILKPELPKACLLGTASIDLASKKKFEKMFSIKVFENYGTSETTFISAELEKKNIRSDYSVGQLLPWIKIKKNKKKHFDLTLKNPFQFEGYIKNNILKLEKFDYFQTGDICVLQKNKNIKIVDRKRRIVKRGGLMIPLKLIEDLASSIEGVEECLAKKVKHEFYGESFKLYFTESKKKIVSINKIENIFRNQFSKNYWPDEFIKVKNFKKTISQKIKI